MPNLTLLNLTYASGATPSTAAPAGEAQILPDIIDKSNLYLVKKLIGTNKSGVTECLKIVHRGVHIYIQNW